MDSSRKILIYVLKAQADGKSNHEIILKLKEHKLSNEQINQALKDALTADLSLLESEPTHTPLHDSKGITLTHHPNAADHTSFNPSPSPSEDLFLTPSPTPSESGFMESPFKTIWFHPTNTFREILYKTPKYCLNKLIIFGGISQIIPLLQIFSIGDYVSFPLILLLILFFGSLIGFIQNFLGSILLLLFGKLLGGEGTVEEIRTSLAWSYLPSAMLLFLVSIPEIIYFGMDYFVHTTEFPELNMLDSLIILVLAAYSLPLYLIFGIYSIIFSLKFLAIAQKFSVWRAILNQLFLLVGIGLATFLFSLIAIGVLVGLAGLT